MGTMKYRDLKFTLINVKKSKVEKKNRGRKTNSSEETNKVEKRTRSIGERVKANNKGMPRHDEGVEIHGLATTLPEMGPGWVMERRWAHD